MALRNDIPGWIGVSGTGLRPGLSPREATFILRLIDRGHARFSTNEAFEVMKTIRSSISRQEVWNMLSRLTEERWLMRLERGKYAVIPLEAGEARVWAEHPFLLAQSFVRPAVISYQTAMNYHNLTEQVPYTTYVASTAPHCDVEIQGARFRFVLQRPGRFFGHQVAWTGTAQATVTDLERTIVDAFDRPQYCGGFYESAKALLSALPKLDLSVIGAYARRLGNQTVLKRIGFILEALGLGDNAHLENWRKDLSRGWPLLDPHGPRSGTYSVKWRLVANVPVRELEAWKES